MRWNFKPVSFFKQIAATASVFTMCLSPVAQGAEAANQKKLINQFLKETGLTTKKMTVGEYWRMVRHVYPASLQSQLDVWVSLNRNEMMPSIEASSFKDAEGKEQVRLTLSSGGQTANLTFTGDEEKPMNFNGVSFSKKELLNHNSFNALAKKLSKEDAALGKVLKKGSQKALSTSAVLTYKEYVKLSANQKAEYMVRLRQAMEAAQRVYQTIYGEQAYNELNNKYEWVLQAILGDAAEAAKGKKNTSGATIADLTGKPCIVAGYLSIYGELGSCGGSEQGAADLKNKMEASKASCANNGVACNPMVYGFDQGGAAYCIDRSLVRYATRDCNKKSPLKNDDPKLEGENKKRIIESYLKKVKGQEIDLKLNAEGKISEEQFKQISSYLEDLSKYINSAIAECDQAPLKDIQKLRKDQVSACEEIRTRVLSLQTFAVKPEPVPVPTLPDPGAAENCNDKKMGSETGPDGKTCICPQGSKDGTNEQGQPICAVIEGGSSPEPTGAQKEPECGFWCRNKNWMIPVGVGLLGLGLFWWLFKDKSKAGGSPVYIPPAPVPGPSPTVSPTVPPVNPPPPSPCPAPNEMVNGICVPPVVVPPPNPVTSEGGTRTDQPGRAGGTR